MIVVVMISGGVSGLSDSYICVLYSAINNVINKGKN